jgi:hypothetical protein
VHGNDPRAKRGKELPFSCFMHCSRHVGRRDVTQRDKRSIDRSLRSMVPTIVTLSHRLSTELHRPLPVVQGVLYLTQLIIVANCKAKSLQYRLLANAVEVDYLPNGLAQSRCFCPLLCAKWLNTRGFGKRATAFSHSFIFFRPSIYRT